MLNSTLESDFEDLFQDGLASKRGPNVIWGRAFAEIAR
jgi:hypothetical protein